LLYSVVNASPEGWSSEILIALGGLQSHISFLHRPGGLTANGMGWYMCLDFFFLSKRGTYIRWDRPVRSQQYTLPYKSPHSGIEYRLAMKMGEGTSTNTVIVTSGMFSSPLTALQYLSITRGGSLFAHQGYQPVADFEGQTSGLFFAARLRLKRSTGSWSVVHRVISYALDWIPRELFHCVEGKQMLDRSRASHIYS